MDYYTHPPPGATVIAADELGPVRPRTVDPPAGWSPDGHRPKAPLTYGRDRRRPGSTAACGSATARPSRLCAPSRNGAHWQEFLTRLERANPTGTIAVITDNLSSHSSLATRVWLAGHPRLQQVFIPKGAC